jgi:hypothetical protein
MFFNVKTINNPKTESGEPGWRACDVCQKKREAYLKIEYSIPMTPGTPPVDIIICKACLTRGVKLIDEAILNQAKGHITEIKDACLRCGIFDKKQTDVYHCKIKGRCPGLDMSEEEKTKFLEKFFEGLIDKLN